MHVYDALHCSANLIISSTNCIRIYENAFFILSCAEYPFQMQIRRKKQTFPSKQRLSKMQNVMILLSCRENIACYINYVK